MRTYSGYGKKTYKPRAYKKKATVRKTYRKSAPKTSIVKVVKRTMRSMAEKKINNSILDRSLGVVPFYTNFSSENIFNVNRLVIDPISQGTGQADRIGNRVRSTGCYFNFVIYPSADTGVPIVIPPFEVKLWVVHSKKYVNDAGSAEISDIMNATMFQYGNSELGMLGRLTDITQMINKDELHVYYQKTFKVGVQYGATAINSASTNYFGNNDFKLNCKHSINLTPYIAKNIIYDDSLNEARNKRLFVVFQVVYANGATPTGPSTFAPIKLQGTLNYTYTDV